MQWFYQHKRAKPPEITRSSPLLQMALLSHKEKDKCQTITNNSD